MMRLLPLLAALVLVSCAPVRDFNASLLNEAGDALNVTTGHSTPGGGTVTITPPAGGLERVRLDLEGVGPLSVEHDACEPLSESVAVCEWDTLTEITTIIFEGERVSGLATYRLPGEGQFRWEFLRY